MLSHADLFGVLVSKVLRSICVDDVVMSAQSEEQAYRVYTGAKALLKTCSIFIRSQQIRAICKPASTLTSQLISDSSPAIEAALRFFTGDTGWSQGLNSEW